MPQATDFAGFGAIGVPLFNSPATGFTPAWPAHTVFNPGPWQKPLAGAFTAIGTTITSLVDRADRLVASTPTNTGKIIGLIAGPIPATPYTIDIVLGMSGSPVSSADSLTAGIVLYDGTKLESIFGGFSAGATALQVQTWTNVSTNSATPINTKAGVNVELFQMRLTDDGTTRIMYSSNNGKDFARFFSEGTNTFLTPTQYGIGFYSTINPASGSVKNYIHHFQLSAGLLGDLPY